MTDMYRKVLSDFEETETMLSRLKEEDIEAVLDEYTTKDCADQEPAPCPQIPVRRSLKDIDPKLLITLSSLRNTHKLSFSATLKVFACVANTFFDQDYKLGKAAVKTRRSRDIIPKSSTTAETETDVAGAEPKKRKISVDVNTLPSKTCVRNYEMDVHLPLALKSNAEAIKAAKTVTLEIDGFSSRRSKGTVMGVMVTNDSGVQYLPIGCDQSTGSDADATATHVMTKLRILGCLIAGPKMRPAVTLVDQLRVDMGILTELIWTHCNAHIEPALNTALTKVLLGIEEVLVDGSRVTGTGELSAAQKL